MRYLIFDYYNVFSYVTEPKNISAMNPLVVVHYHCNTPLPTHTGTFFVENMFRTDSRTILKDKPNLYTESRCCMGVKPISAYWDP